MGNLLDYLFGLFFVLLILSISGFVALAFLHAFPTSPITATLNYIFNYSYTFFDDSIVLVFVLTLLFDLINSYYHPSLLMAVVNILMIFFLGYIWLVFANIAPVILGPFNSNTLLPITTALFTNTYLAVVLFFFMIFSVIMNIWGRN